MFAARGAKRRETPSTTSESRYAVFTDATPGGRSAPAQTPRSHAGSDTLFIVSLVENRANEVGMAALDLKTNHMHLTQVSDNSAYSSTLAMLTMYSPKEVLVSGNARQTKLTCTVRTALPETMIADIERKYFSDTEGMLLFQDTSACVLRNVTLKELESKYLCACAFNALYRYANYIQRTGSTGMPYMQISYKVHENLMRLEFSTLKSLEIIENTKSGNQKSGSLFATINETQTTMGARLLRASLIQPLKSVELINQRLDAVDEIVAKPSLFTGLVSCLSDFPDLEQVTSYLLVKCSAELSFSSMGPINPRTITLLLHLKTAIEKTYEISRVVAEHAQSSLLVSLAKLLRDPPSTPNSTAGTDPLCASNDLEESSRSINSAEHSTAGSVASVASDGAAALDKIRAAIDTKIGADAHAPRAAEALRMHQAYIIKPEVDGLLDVARQTYASVVDDIYAYADQVRDEYQLPDLKISFKTRGYEFVHKLSTLRFLPDIATQKSQQRKNWIFLTKELSALNDRMNESLTDIFSMTNCEVSEILRICREEVRGLYKASEAVAMLDMLASFASQALQAGEESGCRMVRPIVGGEGVLAIKLGRHPILAKLAQTVPNDTFLNEDKHLSLITGPNMSGKSTYLKQVALISILAQTGSYVPADFCSMPCVGRIYTRTSTNDDMLNNQSSFMLEMKEMAQILDGLTYEETVHSAKSLVLIDELGRGTSHTDGASIAWAIVEALLGSSAYVLFVTHFDNLVELERLYDGVQNHHMETGTSTNATNGRLEFKYTVARGPCTDIGYGLQVAELCGLPRATVEAALQIVQQIRDKQATQAEPQPKSIMSRDVALTKDLLLLRGSAMASDPAALRAHLRMMRVQYLDAEA